MALCARLAGLRTPLRGAVRITLRLWFADRRRRDLDNVAKSVLDGLNGTAYDDDSQVTELHVLGAIDIDNPRAEVEISGVLTEPRSAFQSKSATIVLSRTKESKSRTETMLPAIPLPEKRLTSREVSFIVIHACTAWPVGRL